MLTFKGSQQYIQVQIDNIKSREAIYRFKFEPSVISDRIWQYLCHSILSHNSVDYLHCTLEQRWDLFGQSKTAH